MISEPLEKGLAEDIARSIWAFGPESTGKLALVGHCDTRLYASNSFCHINFLLKLTIKMIVLLSATTQDKILLHLHSVDSQLSLGDESIENIKES